VKAVAVSNTGGRDADVDALIGVRSDTRAAEDLFRAFAALRFAKSALSLRGVTSPVLCAVPAGDVALRLPVSGGGFIRAAFSCFMPLPPAARCAGATRAALRVGGGASLRVGLARRSDAYYRRRAYPR